MLTSEPLIFRDVGEEALAAKFECLITHAGVTPQKVRGFEASIPRADAHWASVQFGLSSNGAIRLPITFAVFLFATVVDTFDLPVALAI